MACGFTYTPPYILTPGTTTAWDGLPSCVTPSLTQPEIRPPAQPHTTTRKLQHGEDGLSIKPANVGRDTTGTGISTRYPSTTPVGLALGPDSPWAEQPAPGTLGHTARGILTLVSLLMPAFSLAPPPPLDHSAASPEARRSPTHPHP
jgi:hypothetical protein